MSLDVGILKGQTVDYKLSFENDGYYWYLHPLFEKMHERIGIYIDLFGDAEFGKETIVHMESLLTEAENLISEQPDGWNVHTGKQTHPQEKELYSKVKKLDFMNKLSILRKMVSEIKNNDGRLIFVGD
jgi:hypothetical protein